MKELWKEVACAIEVAILILTLLSVTAVFAWALLMCLNQMESHSTAISLSLH